MNHTKFTRKGIYLNFLSGSSHQSEKNKIRNLYLARKKKKLKVSLQFYLVELTHFFYSSFFNYTGRALKLQKKKIKKYFCIKLPHTHTGCFKNMWQVDNKFLKLIFVIFFYYRFIQIQILKKL